MIGLGSKHGFCTHLGNRCAHSSQLGHIDADQVAVIAWRQPQV